METPVGFAILGAAASIRPRGRGVEHYRWRCVRAAIVLFGGATAAFLLQAACPKPSYAGPSLFSQAGAFPFPGQLVVTGTDSASATLGAASASCATQYGVNRAFASAVAKDAVAQSTSRWLDELLITSSHPEDAGHRFQATFTYHLSGSQSISGSAYSIVDFRFTYDPNDNTTNGQQESQQHFNLQTATTQNIDLNGSLTFDFVEGEPFEFQVQLDLDSGCFAIGATSITDFRSTATFIGVQLPAGFTMSSQSGTLYPIENPIPTIPVTWGKLKTLYKEGN